MTDPALISLVSALSGIFIGWLLNALQSALGTRAANVRTRNLIISQLLEIRHQITKLRDFRLYMDTCLDMVLAIPDEEFHKYQAAVNKQLHLGSSRIRSMVLEMIDVPFRNAFREAIDLLAQISPLRAYQLRGLEQRVALDGQVDSVIQAYLDGFTKTATKEQLQELNVAMERIKEHLYDECVKDLDEQILNLSLQNSPFAYLSCRRLIAKHARPGTEEMRADLAEFFRKAIPGLKIENETGDIA